MTHNILICDDERDIVSALKIYLSGEDYRLFEAYDGRQALEVLKNNDIHLVLLDIMMPKLDGIAATAKIRETSNVPIILLTAKSESGDKVLGLNVGADDYITKPFDPAEVLARVRSQLRRYTRLGAAPEPESAKTWKVGPIALDDENNNTLKRYAGVDPRSRKAVLKYANEAVYPGRTILVDSLTVQGVAKNVFHYL